MFVLKPSASGHDLNVRIQGYLNPKGGRNLERDVANSNVVTDYEAVKKYKPRQNSKASAPVPKPN
jgi:hypothetical protein